MKIDPVHPVNPVEKEVAAQRLLFSACLKTGVGS